MKNLNSVILVALVSGSAVSVTFSSLRAEETIIQQEKMSFERCLKVIAASEDKLSIAPEIIDVTSEKRIAVFTLVDGNLKITCDGISDLVIVSTKMD